MFRPTIGIATDPPVPPSGWFTDNVLVSMVGAPNALGGAITTIRYKTSGAQNLPETTAPEAQATLIVASEGTTTVTAAAQDSFGSLSLPGTVDVRIDRTAPVADCDLPNEQWNADNVSLVCSASDALSGLATTDATFTLSTTVPEGVETVEAVTGTWSLVDLAGNVGSAGPIGGNRVDRKSPSVDIVVPAAAAVYAIGQPVPASYNCADGGSGVAACAGTVPSGVALDTASPGTKSFTVSATDAVGNPSSRSVSYDVGYNICLHYDPTKLHKVGSTVPVKLHLCDGKGANLSRGDIAVVATSVRQVGSTTSRPPQSAGHSNPGNRFRFDGHLVGYIFNLKTTHLARGSWELRFRVAGDPQEHSAPFRLR